MQNLIHKLIDTYIPLNPFSINFVIYEPLFFYSVMASKLNLMSFTLYMFASVCLKFFVSLYNFSSILEMSSLQVTACNVDICSALMAIEQWEFVIVPHLMWHGASVYNGHLRWSMTLTYIAERLAMELSQHVLTTKVCRGWDSNTLFQPSSFEANAFPHCATSAA